MSFTHLDSVLAEVAELGRRFTDAGFRIFLVGGIVRDQWLDESLDASSDIDLTTDARPGDIKQLVSGWATDMWTQGERFGTIGLRAAGRDYEVTTHRAESYSSDSRKPEVSFGDSIEIDLSRRDFTVNAMAIELPGGAVVDPFNGASDLAAGRLSTPLSADLSFNDDPLRMLRAARFATKYALAPDEELVASATDLHERLRIVAIERIGVELRRLLSLEDPTIGLQFLRKTGLLTETLCAGRAELVGRPDTQYAKAIAITTKVPVDWRLRLAGIGLELFAADGHEIQGIRDLCDRLKLSRGDSNYIVEVARGALTTEGSDPRDVRRWADLATHRSDSLQLAVAFRPTASSLFREAYEALSTVEDLDWADFLDGAKIMKTLAVGPGPTVGAGRAHLGDRYYEQGPLTELQQIELLQSWWADRATNA